MRSTVVFPFRIYSNFEVAYDWSAELARRLKGNFSVFTELPSHTGEFAEEFLNFLRANPKSIIVLQSDLLSNGQMRSLIKAGETLIILPTLVMSTELSTQPDSADLFIQTLQKAAIYNMPNSFFKTISEDRSILNALTKFFQK